MLRTWIVGRRRFLPSICQGSNEARRKLINHQVQSLAADIVKSRLRKVYASFRGVADPVLFAHDEIVLECAVDQAEEVMKKAVEIAEKPVKGFCVSLKVDAVVGRSWADKP